MITFNHTYKLRVGMDNLGDALSRKCLLSETPLDTVKDLHMEGVGLIQDVPQMEIRRPETIAKVLRKDTITV